MQIKIINEAGLEEALIGMKFSFQPECDIKDIKPVTSYHQIEGKYKNSLFYKYMETAKKLCKRDGGHNKFLEHIQVWFVLRAPLYFHKQFDTYRVGTSKLSKSTMHTLMKRHVTQNDFEFPDDREFPEWTLRDFNHAIDIKDFEGLNCALPQSFLQTRMVNTNYKVLRNIILQRQGHKLKEWDFFIEEIKKQLANPELLGVD